MAGLGVGPGMPPGTRSDVGNDQKALLNTYIHNYLVHEGHFDLAKAIRNSDMSLNEPKLRKESGNNKQGQVNGADESMDQDPKDEQGHRTDGLGKNTLGDTFLLDYWFIFWDMWSASKRSTDKQSENAAGSYWDVQKAKKTMPPNQQMMSQTMMGANGTFGFPRGGMMQGPNFNLQKAAMANNGRNMQPLRNMQQLAQQQQLPMDGSDVDLNGQQRPQSPMSGGENAPSPKRQRLDGGPFNGGPPMGGPGRNQMLGALPNGAGGNQEAMRMQDPKTLSPAQIQLMLRNNQQNLYSQAVASSTKGMISSAAFANGMAQMSPTMANEAAMDPQAFGVAGRNMGGGGNGGALADYQMQLMLLEQQNKKRLMVARQENAHDRQQNIIGTTGFGAPPMSPRDSRNGQSPPNGTDRRGTPRMGPGSPLPDGSMPQNTGSPAAPNFADPNHMNLARQFVPPNGAMMRPPGVNPMGVPNGQMTPQQMEMLQNTGRLPNGNWQNGLMPGQMGPQGAGPQQGQGDGNQPRGNMPPPQAPPGAGIAGRAQPSPTQQPAATPTPATNSTKNTKKKDGKETKKKNAKKGQTTTGATPNAESERAPTPTPQTPITPVNPESHVIKGQQPTQSTNAQSQSQTTSAPVPMGMPPSQDNGGMNNQPFGAIDTEMFNIGDFPALDNSDVLDGFDFDTFLDPSALGGDFSDFQMPGEGVETGTGDI